MSLNQGVTVNERKEWYENGQLRMHKFYRDEKLDGKCRSWHENGQLERLEFYRNGKLEGERRVWHENGQIRLTEFYRNGLLNGECRIFNIGGRLIEQMFYLDGKMEGVYKTWFYGWIGPNCFYERIQRQEYFQNGVCMTAGFYPRKRLIFSKLKRNFFRPRYPPNTFLISDLTTFPE